MIDLFIKKNALVGYCTKKTKQNKKTFFPYPWNVDLKTVNIAHGVS